MSNSLRRAATARLLSAVTASALLIAFPLHARTSWQPAGDLPPLPHIAPPQHILPPVSLPETPGSGTLAAGGKVFIAHYELVGNHAVDSTALAPLLEPYTQRDVTYEELGALRDSLTRAYITRGYITSGAVIPAQEVVDGVLEIHFIEGHLSEVVVSNAGRLDPGYVRERVFLGAGVPLDVNALEQRLQLLQLDERIASIRATLVPGATRGDSMLQVTLVEASPWQVHAEINNFESPSVGAVRGELQLTHLNVRGIGDRLSGRVRRSTGVIEVHGSYLLPISANDTTLELHARHTRADVVEAPFDQLDINTRADSIGVTVSHPVYRTASERMALSLTAEYRRSRRFLAGSPFSFSAGAEDGVARVAVLRFAQDWSAGNQRDAVALRSTVSVGLDVLGATRNAGDVPDGEFVTWLGQAQYARRVDWLDMLVGARAAVQLSTSPLLGLEKFALGGHASVRGYREGAVVQDNGAYLSLQATIPVLRRGVARPMLELTPFIDIGHAWRSGGNDSTSARDATLAGAGLSLRWTVSDHISAEGTFATALRTLRGARDSDLQDDGVQFRLSADF